MRKIRRLHVWEHPDLHRSDPVPALGHIPVHVVYEEHEFHWWAINRDGALVIGFYEDRPLFLTKPDSETAQAQVVHTHLTRGMFAKAWEETITDESSGPVASDGALPAATMPQQPATMPAAAPMGGDATGVLPRVSMTTEVEVERTVTYNSVADLPNDGMHPRRETVPEALESDSCMICGSVEHFTEEHLPKVPSPFPPILPMDATRFDLKAPPRP